MGEELEKVGSMYFLAQAFFDFIVISIYFSIILFYGAEANLIDDKIKKFLIKI